MPVKASVGGGSGSGGYRDLPALLLLNGSRGDVVVLYHFSPLLFHDRRCVLMLLMSLMFGTTVVKQTRFPFCSAFFFRRTGPSGLLLLPPRSTGGNTATVAATATVPLCDSGHGAGRPSHL